MINNEITTTKGMESAQKALEQAKNRVAVERRKANAERRKFEDHNKYMMGGAVHKYWAIHDKKKLAQNDSEEGNARKWIDLIKDYTDITELDAEMLNRVVNKIVVHEDITANGDRNITMETHYNFRPDIESKIYNLSDVAETTSVAKAM